MEFLLLTLAGSVVVRLLLTAYGVDPLVSGFAVVLWLAACLAMLFWGQMP